ncbi:hypothetical protein NPX79_02450 [Spiroplasma endosymbiont of Anurida maritima]|uniref:hypothetical protein n=1 Tax=Spiroplasma endosymbiont of Anurida maritima TaxID=2967972 RepID=UPI0036D4390E
MFPWAIESNEISETYKNLNTKTSDFLNQLGNKILSGEYGFLFNGLSSDQIFSAFSLKNLQLYKFDIVEQVNNQSEYVGYNEIIVKAEQIPNTKKLSADFGFELNYVKDKEILKFTSNGLSNQTIYVAEKEELLKDVIEWLKKNLTSISDLLKEHTLTFEGQDKVQEFNDIDKLFGKNNDVEKILSELPGFDISKLKVESWNYDSSVKSFTSRTIVDNMTGVKSTQPIYDGRGEPNVRESSIVPYVAGLGGIKKSIEEYENHFTPSEYEDTASDTMYRVRDALMDKENFIESVLYGTINSIQNFVDLRKGDAVLYGEIPGLLSFDKAGSQSFVGKYEDKETSYETGIKENYFDLITNFYNKNMKGNFSSESTKDKIKLQSDLIIEKEGKNKLFTESTLVDTGYLDITSWSYDGMPLEALSDLTLFSITPDQISVEQVYRNVLDYSFELLLNSKIEASTMFGFLNRNHHNIYGQGNIHFRYWFSSPFMTQNLEGTQAIVLKSEDFKTAKYSKTANANDAMNYIMKQNEDHIKDKVKNIVPFEISISDNLQITNINQVYSNVEAYRGTVDMLFRDTLTRYESAEVPNNLSNIESNILINIGGVDFALNQFNLWRDNYYDNLQMSRWNLGTAQIAYIPSTGESDGRSAGYDGLIFPEE